MQSIATFKDNLTAMANVYCDHRNVAVELAADIDPQGRTHNIAVYVRRKRGLGSCAKQLVMSQAVPQPPVKTAKKKTRIWRVAVKEHVACEQCRAPSMSEKMAIKTRTFGSYDNLTFKGDTPTEAAWKAHEWLMRGGPGGIMSPAPAWDSHIVFRVKEAFTPANAPRYFIEQSQFLTKPGDTSCGKPGGNENREEDREEGTEVKFMGFYGCN